MKLLIDKTVYLWLKEYSNQYNECEVGSFLVGSYTKDNSSEMTVYISAAIEAKYAAHEKASITFTHDTWNYVNNELDTNYPDKTIIGWHHTHPGYGVFLSEYDLFIQNNFFNLDFQIAMVIDPINRSEGVFFWSDGSIALMDDFIIYDKERDLNDKQ